MKTNRYDGRHADSIAEFYRDLQILNKDARISIILIGSAARNTETWRSDVDLLVLADQLSNLPPNRGKFHLHLSSKDKFLQMLRERDDFAAWCTRYGVTIVDSGDWAAIRQSSEAGVWPDWRRKIPHATRRLILGSVLLRTGDEEAAAEELLYSLAHVARALLIRAEVFPLSRAELSHQVREIGYSNLAMALERLLYEEPADGLLRQVKSYSKKLLCHLDRGSFRRYSSDLARRGSRKKHRI